MEQFLIEEAVMARHYSKIAAAERAEVQRAEARERAEAMLGRKKKGG